MNLQWTDKLFWLSWKKLLLIPAAWVLCVILHNAIYGLFQSYFGPGGDEPFFFLLAVVVIPLYTIVSLLYSLVRFGVWLATRQTQQ